MLLKDLRIKWEKGLTPKTVIDDTLLDGMGAVLVVLEDALSIFHLHRYIRLADCEWACSVDDQSADFNAVLRWLNDPCLLAAKGKYPDTGEPYEVQIPTPYENEVPQEA